MDLVISGWNEAFVSCRYRMIRVILEAQSIAEKNSEKEAEDTTLHHHYIIVLPPRLTPSLIQYYYTTA